MLIPIRFASGQPGHAVGSRVARLQWQRWHYTPRHTHRPEHAPLQIGVHLGGALSFRTTLSCFLTYFKQVYCAVGLTGSFRLRFCQLLSRRSSRRGGETHAGSLYHNYTNVIKRVLRDPFSFQRPTEPIHWCHRCQGLRRCVFPALPEGGNGCSCRPPQWFKIRR